MQEIDGHDLEAIDAAYAQALAADAPGGDLRPHQEGLRRRRGRGPAEPARQAAGRPRGGGRGAGRRSARCGSRCSRRPRRRRYEIAQEAVERPSYEVGEKVATRGAYGDALAWLGSIDERVVALDGEVGNSTYAERFAAKHPDRFFEMYIAEQQMVAAAVGLQTRGWKPFASSFGAFLSRAYDFVRMAAISDADLKLCGSHVGVSIGPDGPSQMALEDIASLRAVFGSVVLYPCDANQTVQLLDAMREHRGDQLHAHDPRARPRCSTSPDESFEIGGSRTLRSSDEDAVTLIGAGITLHECLAAADELAEQGIAARVIDLYSVKPVDADDDPRPPRPRRGRWSRSRTTGRRAGSARPSPASSPKPAAGTPLISLAVSERPGSGPPEASRRRRHRRRAASSPRSHRRSESYKRSLIIR